MAPVSDQVDVYFDYVCPYAWRAAELAEHVAQRNGVRFAWHHFSLYQAAYAGRDPWFVWNEPLDPADETGGRGLLAFLASLAARRQGPDAADRFRMHLLRARHREGRPFDDATVRAAAAAAGLHLPRFESDLADPEARTLLARQHCEALEREVRVTPTFVFPDGSRACVRLACAPEGGEAAADLFDGVRDLLSRHPTLESVSRPRSRCN